MRSAKQRANDRRLGRMAKKRFSAKRKTPVKRRTTFKVPTIACITKLLREVQLDL